MAEKILEVTELKKYFKTPHGLLHAVDGVSFSVDAGKTLGVGEGSFEAVLSGSGELLSVPTGSPLSTPTRSEQ